MWSNIASKVHHAYYTEKKQRPEVYYKKGVFLKISQKVTGLYSVPPESVRKQNNYDVLREV